MLRSDFLHNMMTLNASFTSILSVDSTNLLPFSSHVFTNCFRLYSDVSEWRDTG